MAYSKSFRDAQSKPKSDAGPEPRIRCSNFGMSVGSRVPVAEAACFWAFRSGDLGMGLFSRALRRERGGADSELNCKGAQREGGKS